MKGNNKRLVLAVGFACLLAPLGYAVQAARGQAADGLAAAILNGESLSGSAEAPATMLQALQAAAGVEAQAMQTFGVSGATAPPGPPSNLRASLSGNTLSLAWDAPTTGEAPTTYIIEVGTSSGLANLATFVTGSTATGIVAPNVPAGTYFIRVRAGNDQGMSAPTNEVTGTVGGPGPCQVPGAPLNLVATVTGATIEFTWQAPTTGGPVSTYVIQAGTTPGSTNISLPAGNGTSFTINGAPAGTAFARLRGTSACGIGPVSNEVTVTVGAAPSPGPTPPPDPGGNRTPNPPGPVCATIFSSGCNRLPVPGYGEGVVFEVARRIGINDANSCPEHGAFGWTFLDAVVDALRTFDTRWAYNGKRGNPLDPSRDIVAYNWGDEPDLGFDGRGTHKVYIFDVVSSMCEGGRPTWINQTGVGGADVVWISRGRFPGGFGFTAPQ